MKQNRQQGDSSLRRMPGATSLYLGTQIALGAYLTAHDAKRKATLTAGLYASELATAGQHRQIPLSVLF